MKNKIIMQDELKELMVKYKKQEKIIVATSGCFDILHAGHVTYLEEASRMGDILIVLLNSDLAVKNLKGEQRPIVPQTERAVVLAGLESVDYVVIFDEQTPCRIISEIQPDIWIKGGDYKGKYIPEMDILAEYGGSVEYVSLVDGCSSTNIIKQIKNLDKNGGNER